MSDSNSNVRTNINNGFVTPDYPEEVKEFSYKNEEEYQAHFKELIATHGFFMCHNIRNNIISENLIRYRAHKALKTEYWTCDHAFKKRARTVPDDPNIKRRQTKKPSKKIGCKAKFSKIIFADDTIEVKYTWKHTGHDPNQDTILPAKRKLLQYEEDLLDARITTLIEEYENSKRAFINKIDDTIIVKEGEGKKHRIKKLEAAIRAVEQFTSTLRESPTPSPE